MSQIHAVQFYKYSSNDIRYDAKYNVQKWNSGRVHKQTMTRKQLFKQPLFVDFNFKKSSTSLGFTFLFHECTTNKY